LLAVNHWLLVVTFGTATSLGNNAPVIVINPCCIYHLSVRPPMWRFLL